MPRPTRSSLPSLSPPLSTFPPPPVRPAQPQFSKAGNVEVFAGLSQNLGEEEKGHFPFFGKHFGNEVRRGSGGVNCARARTMASGDDRVASSTVARPRLPRLPCVGGVCEPFARGRRRQRSRVERALAAAGSGTGAVDRDRASEANTATGEELCLVRFGTPSLLYLPVLVQTC